MKFLLVRFWKQVTAIVLLGTLGIALSSSSSAFSDARPAPDHPSEVSIFYYPWYGTQSVDKMDYHWGVSNNPTDTHSDYFPLHGIYSSTDASVVDTQMQEISSAGIDTVVVSWWGQGSFEDKALKVVLQSAGQHHLSVAAHIEPYGGRGAATIANDYGYLRGLGIKTFYVYQANRIDQGALTAANDSVRPDVRVFADAYNGIGLKDGSFMQFASQAHFDGVYTYDVVGLKPGDLGNICSMARDANLLCVPSVGPGFSGTRSHSRISNVGRQDGAYYDSFWQGAIDAHPDIVSITSFNEWNEGTQIEPAQDQCIDGQRTCYSNYDGAWGKSGLPAAFAYMTSTYNWVVRAKGHQPDLGNRMTIIRGALNHLDNTSIGQVHVPYTAPATP